jgi:hypothetical protein
MIRSSKALCVEDIVQSRWRPDAREEGWGEGETTSYVAPSFLCSYSPERVSKSRARALESQSALLVNSTKHSILTGIRAVVASTIFLFGDLLEVTCCSSLLFVGARSPLNQISPSLLSVAQELHRTARLGVKATPHVG